MRLANTCTIVGELMIESNNYGLTEKGLVVITESYIYSLLQFATLYIDKFEAELHFPDEANHLIQATIWFIECYLTYKDKIEEARLQKKKEKTKKLRARRAHEKKKSKIKDRKL